MKWFLMLFCAHAALGGTLQFQSGPDTACSRNCLYVSINNAKYRLVGCNKAKLGRCKSQGGRPVSFAFPTAPTACQKLRIKVVTQGKDGGTPHFTFDSLKPDLLRNRDYLVNSRTSSSVDLWLNDNEDHDPYDFRVILSMADGVPFAIPGLDGVNCP